ncbi:hypothetical protein DFS34DRAFT_598214 [Phlyctochytrium arcticum]|nr:hypothetical protein DFS34DRAFT_598214 [Phlyctochytrium arcticum]
METELRHWIIALSRLFTINFCVNHYDGALRNEAERSMRGQLFNGQVEFVWACFSLCVFVVMEMKRKGFESENYAQLMGELEAAAFTNYGNRTTVENVLGVMANKDGWIFMAYDTAANTFQVSRTLNINSPDDLERINARATCSSVSVVWFLQGYCTAVVAMQKRSRATCRQIEDEIKYTVPTANEAKRRIILISPQDPQALSTRRGSAGTYAFQAKSMALEAKNATEFDNALALLQKAIPEHYHITPSLLEALSPGLGFKLTKPRYRFRMHFVM